MPAFIFDIPKPAGRTVVLCLLPFALVYGILSAVRWPETYALSHMVIDYHFGFGKRGLIGAILERIDRPPYHYVTLAWMAFAITALWLATLIAAAWSSLRHDTGLVAAFLLFFLSAGFSSLVDDVGRGEHFGLLITIPCLLTPARLSWLPIRAVAVVLAVLMQEANFMFVVPIVAFDTWIGLEHRSRFQPLLFAFATILPATLLTWHLGNLRTACDTAEATNYFQHMAADFQMQGIPVVTLCMNGAANFRLVSRALWSVNTAAAIVPLAILASVPSTMFNLTLTHRAVRGSRIGIISAVIVTLGPIALLLVGADVVRFVTLIQLTSLLVLVSTVRRRGLPRGGTYPRISYRACLVMTLVAFELGTSLPLNDGNEMLKFPFTPLVVRAIAIGQGKASFVVIP